MNISSFLKVSPQELLRRLMARQSLVLGAAVVLCGFILANIIYQKQQQRIKAVEAEIAQQEQKISLAKELAALDDKLKTITTTYIKKDNSFTIDKFNEFASSAGAKITSLSVENETDSGLYTVTAYRLSIRADYHSVGKFISALESAGDIVKIEEFSLSLAAAQARARRPQGPNRANILNVNIRVSVSFLKIL